MSILDEAAYPYPPTSNCQLIVEEVLMTIILQIYFKVEAATAGKFENMYLTSYRPALQKQDGYQGSRLLRIFDKTISTEISAAPTHFNYQIELEFGSEEARRAWVQTPEHNHVWSLATALATSAEWRGYDLVDNDIYKIEV